MEAFYGRRTVYHSRTLKADFELNRKGIRGIALGRPLRDAVHAIAEKALPYAVSISPRETGQYADSFSVTDGHTWVAAMRRVAARLQNDDPGAAAIEWGTAASEHHEATEAHRVLGRTLDHIGRRPTPRAVLRLGPTGGTGPLQRIASSPAAWRGERP